MAFDRSKITRDYVSKACELLVCGEHPARTQAKGLFIIFNGQRLPAKHVIRLAYCLANGLAIGSQPKFASGQGTLDFLRRLGFTVERTAVDGERSTPT